MFSNKMLHKVIFSITRVHTIVNLANPPFQMAVAFIIVSNPVRFTFEAFGFFTFLVGACKGLKVLVNMFDPILNRSMLANSYDVGVWAKQLT